MSDVNETAEENTEAPEIPVGIDPNVAAALLENQISEPKSSQGLFDLPCGYIDREGVLHTEIKVREITGHEEDMLANPKIKSNKKINDLITRCVERVGAITDKGKLSQVVLDMTVGDRLFAVFAIRRVTVGDEYTYEAKCPSCQARTKFTIDLSDLETKPMPEPTRRVYDVELPRSGKMVRFVPMTGRGEEQLTDLTKRVKDTLSLALAIRITEIDGERPTLASLKDLSMGDRAFLRQEFDRVEGGIDTSVDLDCPECYHEFSQDVDVSQAGFFFPTGTQRS